MLNEHLKEEELQSSLRDFLDFYNLFFAQWKPEERITIYQNKKILAKLHHALNIEKYGQAAFMQNLLVGAPADKTAEFAKEIGVEFHNYDETKTEEFRNHLALFKWGENDATRAFVKVFGYPDYMIPSDSGTIQSEEMANPSDTPFKQLKDYQAEISFKAIRHLERANTRFLIQMPTGSGKTRVAMEVISHFLNENSERSVVWLAERAELCEQAMETFIDVWSHLGQRAIGICRLWGDTDVASISGTAKFTVAMYQKIRNSLKDKRLTIKTDLIVPDEAHTAIAPTYSKTIESLMDRRTKQTRIMGLTATPGRGNQSIEENKELSMFFGGNIVEIESEHGAIEFLRRRRILARCDRSPLNTNIQYTFTMGEWRALSASFEREFPNGLLEKIAKDNTRNMKIILKLLDIAKERKHVLVFCGSRWQSKLLCGAMIALDYAAAYVDGSSPRNHRRDTVKKFKSGEIQFMFNYGVFAAGLDVPNIDAVVITRPTASVVLYSQMIGRGMRGSAIGGTDAFLLVDVVDDIITETGELDDVYEYFSEYWDDA